MIDIKKRYRTVRGERVILDTADIEQDIVSGTIQYPVPRGPDEWHLDGRSYFIGQKQDLVEDIGGLQSYIWVNVYLRDGDRMEIDAHLSRELADELCAPGRVACIKTAMVGGYGHGLTAKDFTYSIETEDEDV